jgi:hypothetical protein
MESNVVIVFTGEPLETILEQRGSGQWRASAASLQHCSWLIATRNRHSRVWKVEDSIAHRAAFLIGHISEPRPSEKEPGRQVIGIDRYAEIEVANIWPGNQNPVAYSTLETLAVDLKTLDWRSL